MLESVKSGPSVTLHGTRGTSVDVRGKDQGLRRGEDVHSVDTTDGGT